MLRFNDNAERRPRNYLLRREQWRLLVMVAMLGLVALAMQRVRSPEGIETLERAFGGEQGAVAADVAAGPVGQQPENGSPAAPSPTLPPLDASRFEQVQDNTKFRNDEAEAWFYVWGELQKTPDAVAPADRAAISYAQLIEQPNVYRGQPVRVVGRLRRVETIRPAKNDLGIEQLYRLIIQLPGRQSWPLTLYSLDPPSSDNLAGDSLMGEVDLPMRAAGYFFKNQSYASPSGVGLTPIVMVQSVDLLRTARVAKETSEPIEFSTVLIAAATISVLMIGFFVMRSQANSGRPSRSRVARQGEIAIEIPELAPAENAGVESDGHGD